MAMEYLLPFMFGMTMQHSVDQSNMFNTQEQLELENRKLVCQLLIERRDRKKFDDKRCGTIYKFPVTNKKEK